MYVVAQSEHCRAWNLSRQGEDAYNTATYVNCYSLPMCILISTHVSYNSLDNLIMRYEEPSSMVRWDSPLFTVPWTDEDVPGEEIWLAITEGVVKPPNAGTSAVRLNFIVLAGIRINSIY